MVAVASWYDAVASAGDDLADSADYAGDVVFVREDEETDQFDGEEWLTSQMWFDAAWEGHEDDTRDLPGSATWGTEDSFASDPLQATEDTASDVFAVLTGNFDYETPDGSGDGNQGTDVPWKAVGTGLALLVVLFVLRPYVEAGAAVGGS